MLALEDAQWADPTTLEVLRGIAERGARAPLFVLVTARPEFRPPWGMRSHHSTISLAPLDRDQARHMVAELTARHALAKEVVEGVTERTGGVPLFVEEVTRLLLERGEQGSMHAIPPTRPYHQTRRIKEASASNYPPRTRKQLSAAVSPTVIGSNPPNCSPVLAKALLLNRGSFNLCIGPIASYSNLATNLHHLVVRQFEDIGTWRRRVALACHSAAPCPCGRHSNPHSACRGIDPSRSF